MPSLAIIPMSLFDGLLIRVLPTVEKGTCAHPPQALPPKLQPTPDRAKATRLRISTAHYLSRAKRHKLRAYCQSTHYDQIFSHSRFKRTGDPINRCVPRDRPLRMSVSLWLAVTSTSRYSHRCEMSSMNQLNGHFGFRAIYHVDTRKRVSDLRAYSYA